MRSKTLQISQNCCQINQVYPQALGGHALHYSPLVTVVIPTYRRAQLVKRAAESALAQTLAEIEVIVVIDGPDEEVRSTLATIEDARLKVIELPTNQGSRAARNAGIAAANAEWIAFLDDDDEWLPQKLQLQWMAAKKSQFKYPIISSHIIAHMPQGESVWPRRIPQPSEQVSEYLFVRNTLFQGEGLIHTSTILTAKELLQQVPFDINLQRHDDWDWLLRATTTPGVGIEFVPQVLSVWYIGEARPSLSKSSNWRFSLEWIQSKRHLVTPRAYSSFILAEVSARAASARDGQAFFILLLEAIRFGKPQPKDIGLFLGMWLIPPQTRTWLRNLLLKKPRALPI
ncbi:MAG: glycosyltransferase family 2 protein [Nostocaceae cyanobacterium]|nr:glycosyltransferase family 2 protein [Nostocaceae cyanobacterium]